MPCTRHPRRWAVLWGWRLLTTAVAAAWVSACSLLAPHLEKPEISVAGIQWVGGNLLRQDFKVTLAIHNPNPRQLPVQSVTAQLRVGGDLVAEAMRAEPFVVPASGDLDVDVRLSADLALVLLKLTQQKAAIDYDLAGVAQVELPWLRSLPFHQTGSLPLQSSPR